MGEWVGHLIIAHYTFTVNSKIFIAPRGNKFRWNIVYKYLFLTSIFLATILFSSIKHFRHTSNIHQIFSNNEKNRCISMCCFCKCFLKKFWSNELSFSIVPGAYHFYLKRTCTNTFQWYKPQVTKQTFLLNTSKWRPLF